MNSHADSSHDNHQHGSSQKTLLPALVLTMLFAAVEAVSGWMSNLLALIGILDTAICRIFRPPCRSGGMYRFFACNNQCISIGIWP